MPLLTYSLSKKLLDQIENFDIDKLNRFNFDIEDLNFNKKAIYLSDDKINNLKIINKKIQDLNKGNLSIELLEKVTVLTNLIRIINNSIIFGNCISYFTS